jgi:4-nitrophenol 2-monooxygenase / 4-nitrocatechol 4-monooxygenase, reductase component
LSDDTILTRVSGAETARSRQLTAAEFRDVIGHFASGVTVITTTADGRPLGTTASAVTSLALEPPMLLVCMNRDSATGRAMAGAGAFAVNILGEEHGELAVRFARKGGDKFAGVELDRGEAGQPLLAGAIAHLECRVTEQVAAGTHIVFIAEVVAATAQPGAPPLAYFRGRFGRLELAEDDHLQPREPLTADEIRDADAARRAIELGVIEQTVGRASAAAIAGLRRLVDDDLAFHEHLVGLAGSAALLTSYRGLGVAEDAAADADEHRRLVEAYEAGDLEAARAVLARHR